MKLQTYVKDGLGGQRLNLLNKFLADYIRNSTNQYNHFLYRLTGKELPDHMKRKNTYNDRISAQRKENRLLKSKVLEQSHLTNHKPHLINLYNTGKNNA